MATTTHTPPRPGGHCLHLAGTRTDVEKQVLDRLLRRLRRGVLTVVYWDGERRTYGEAAPGPDAARAMLRIADAAVLRRAAFDPSAAFGEAYASGAVEVAEDDLPALFRIVYENRDAPGVLRGLRALRPRERNRRSRQQHQIRRHYDVGNDYYRLFLDPTLTYSCAYFEHDDDPLEQAQHQKIEHVLRKLRVGPGHTLLDVGCGWGHLAVTAAARYGARVVGITLSAEQLAAARRLAEREGVADRVRFALCNYQDLRTAADPALRGPFDRIVSVGMFEHTGRRGQARYVELVAALLADGGVSVLHTITDQHEKALDSWTDRHVFPGGRLPTVGRVEHLLAEHGLWSLDRENLWQHYARTLERWRREHRRHRREIVARYDEAFYRTRDLWLAGSQAGFRHGDLGLSQFVISKGKPRDWPLTRADLYRPAPVEAPTPVRRPAVGAP